MKTASPSHTRRSWIRWTAGVCTCLLALAAVLLAAAVARPGWYQPATVAPDEYPALRNELPNFGSAIGSYMERGQPFRITLLDSQVNRWLAARAEIWPGLRDDLPREMAGPVVSFQPGRIVLGVQYNGPRISSILSLAVNLRLEASRGAIHVEVDSLRAGYLPVPRTLVDARARKALDREAGRQVASLLRHVRSQAGDYLPIDTSAGGVAAAEIPLAAMLGDIWEFRLPARNRWPNGGFPYTISALRIERGKLTVDITPLPRQASRPSSDSRPGRDQQGL